MAIDTSLRQIGRRGAVFDPEYPFSVLCRPVEDRRRVPDLARATDEARERRIKLLGALMTSTPNRVLRSLCWRRIRFEIHQRSADQVRRMEAALGLL
ncbi:MULTISPECIES: hypothetical protein [Pandoraea]|uniref:hypothetical protein n=1 Tax=Pandoraea TaxID=93217 RepID=UPI001F5CCA4C|nr:MULTISPECIES: hypothetical protein [Pandoraea]MCI3206542.1 hypothetical protein [Pandoraea sp. LA3]MDN4584570.1 hypothetical protein [Pandoraea capi]